MGINVFILIVLMLLVVASVVTNVVVYYLLNQSINNQGDLIMAISKEVKELQDKIDTLTQAEADREARDVQQDAVTQQQIALLTQTITDLQNQIANGTLSPDDAAAVNASIAKVQATIDSLNAADPTPPVVP
jgi:peptidoglycan hydrolase CwlO-like protein